MKHYCVKCKRYVDAVIRKHTYMLWRTKTARFTPRVCCKDCGHILDNADGSLNGAIIKYQRS